MTFYEYIRSLNSGMSLYQYDSLPACYCTSFPLTSIFDTPEKFHKAIELAAQDSRRGVLLLSITERDAHHQMWLEELKEYKHTIVETKSRHHGDYKCWFICIPME